MSGLDRVTSNAPDRKAQAMGQNEVTGSYYPLDSHESMNRFIGKNIQKREFIDASQMRIERFDPICSYTKPDVRSTSSMTQNPQHARGFASLAGASWEAPRDIYVLGVANETYLPMRGQTTKLHDYLYQTTVSNRLNGQFNHYPTSVEIGDPLVLYFPTKQDYLNNAIDWCPESSSLGRIRDLPMIKPLRSLATQNVDMDTIFERATKNALERCEMFRDQRSKAVKTSFIPGSQAFEEELDKDTVNAMANQLFSKCLPEFRAYVFSGDKADSTGEMTATDREAMKSTGFTTALQHQMHHILYGCHSTEDFAAGQQFIFSIQMLLNHIIYSQDSVRKFAAMSKFMTMGKTMAETGKYIALLGQSNIEQSMNMMYGLSMSTGAFRDNVTIYVQPHPIARPA